MTHFRRVSRESVFDGRLVKVRIDTFHDPDGRPFRREVIEHPGAVAVVALTADGEVILVRQFRAAVDEELWEIPAGLLDHDGESLVEAAARELHEEVGLAADRWSHLHTFLNSPGCSNERVHIYLAEGLTDIGRNADGPEEEHMTISWVTLGDAVAMVQRGEITDAKTAIGLLLTQAGRPG